MTSEQAEAFEHDPDFEAIIAMRRVDELAKDPDAQVPSLEAWFPLIDKYSTAGYSGGEGYMLSSQQVKFYEENGFLVVPNLLTYLGQSSSIHEIISWVTEISQWEKVDKKWLLHWEKRSAGSTTDSTECVSAAVDNGNDADASAISDSIMTTKHSSDKQLCRVENFVDYHAKMSEFCRGPLRHLCSQLFSEEAALFKEKINFKLPGGAGFAAHQDSPAYTCVGLGQDHISVMVAVDAATINNGCLEVAPGKYTKGQVPLTSDGVVEQTVEATMPFQPVICPAGTVMFFSGYLPHRSGANTSTTSRRALYVTYNPLSQGDLHEKYYLAKHSGSQGFSSNKTISFQNDFKGVIVD